MNCFFLDGSDEKNCKPLAFEVLMIYIGIGAGFAILFGIAINSYLKASFVEGQGYVPGCACIAGIRLFSGCACDLGLRLSTVPAVSSENITQYGLGTEEDLDDVENDLHSFACFYQKWRSSDSVGEEIHNFLLFHKLSSDVFTSINICQMIYEEEQGYNNGNTERTDIFFYQNLDSNDVTDFLYSYKDKGFLVKIKVFLHKHISSLLLPLKFLEQNIHLKKVAIFAICILKTSLHYIDLVKDLFIFSKLWHYITDSNGSILETEYHAFPRAITLALFISIWLSEACTSLVVATFKEKDMLVRCICLLGTPFMSAVALFEEMQAKIGEAKCILEMQEQSNDSLPNGTNSVKSKAKLSLQRKRHRILKSFRAEIKAGEIILENFTQLVIYILIVLVDRSKSRAVANMGEIFLSDIETFLFISAIVSFFGLIMGHINYVTARKDGFVGIVGKVVLFVYFFFGTCMRVFAVALLFTPFLGLFDSTSHAIMGQYGFKATECSASRCFDRVFDVGENGTIISLNDTWNPLQIKDIDEFIGMPSFTPIVTLSLIVVIHLTLACYLLRPLQKHAGKLFLQSIFTLICPPMFADWEEFQRCYPGSDIAESWEKSWTLHKAFLIMNTIEHLVLLFPLVVLKLAADKRNSLLEGSPFPPIKDELHSALIINCLLISWTLLFLITPIIQSFLAKIYFKFGHGWSRILRVHLALQNQLCNDNASLYWSTFCHSIISTLDQLQNFLRGLFSRNVANYNQQE